MMTKLQKPVMLPGQCGPKPEQSEQSKLSKEAKMDMCFLTSVWRQLLIFFYCLFSQLIHQQFALQKCRSVFLKGQDDVLRCHVLSTTQKYYVYCHKERKKQEILVDYQNSWL